MFKLNNKSKKVMRALSLGIVSLGLLAGISMSSNNNAHAMSAIEQKEYDNDIQGAAKDDAISDANQHESALNNLENSPSLREENEKYRPEWLAKNFGSEIFTDDYVKGSKADQRADANFINKYMKHEAKPTTISKKAKKHVNRHDKNLARNKRARRASKRTRKAKKYSYKKAKPVKKSRTKVVKKYSHHSWRHVRPSKNHLSKLNKSHKKNVKRTHKFQRLTKKQVNHFNSLIKKDKRALKSKRAKHNYKYRKTLSKSIKSIQRFLNAKK